MEKYIPIKPRIKLAKDGDRRILIFENYKDVDDEDLLKKYKVKIVTIVEGFNEENFKNLSATKMLTLMDCDFSKFKPKTFYQLEKVIGLFLVDSKMPETLNFKHFPKLEQLELNWNKKYGLGDCNALLEIVIRKIKDEDLSNISDLPKLEKLEIIQSNIKSLNGINRLQNLRILSLYRVKGFSNLMPITELNKLEYLYLNSYHNVINLNQFVALKNLKVLIFENCTNIQSISALESMSSLTGVVLHGKTNLTHEEKIYIKSFDKTKFDFIRKDDVRNKIK